MSTQRIVLTATCTLVLLSHSAVAAEPQRSIESVLAAWEKASQACQSLDVELTVFEYMPFSSEYTTTYGRFYYESPNIGRYEIWKDHQTRGSDWSAFSEVLIWNGKETLWIDPKQMALFRLPEAKLREVIAKPPDESGGFWARFKFNLAWAFVSPQRFLPLVADVRAADVAARFDLTLTRDGEQIGLKAVSKRASDKAWFHEINVLLNAHTYRTEALQVIGPSGYDQRVYVLDNPKINQRPADRDALIAPDMAGLQVAEGF